jgi:CRISPR-associated exonuclease Cas4
VKKSNITFPSSLHTSDVEEAYLSVTDLKHYLYCPRIIYFDKVIHADPILGAQQEASKDTHQELERKEKRRSGAVFYSPEFDTAEKTYRVALQSEKLRLRGILDLLIRTGDEYLPVEYKEMQSDRGKIWPDHKYQLAAYALLVDEAYQTNVRRGIVNYVNEELNITCEISEGIKRYTRKVINEVRSIILEQGLPPVTVPISKCQGGCGYLWICKRK